MALTAAAFLYANLSFSADLDYEPRCNLFLTREFLAMPVGTLLLVGSKYLEVVGYGNETFRECLYYAGAVIIIGDRVLKFCEDIQKCRKYYSKYKRRKNSEKEDQNSEKR